MMPGVRFDCPSASLNLRALLKPTRYALRIGSALALGVHLIFTQLGGSDEGQKVVKPLTTRFVKRQPRLTKPLEMKKRPQPKRRRMQRTMVSVKAKVNRQKVTSQMEATHVMRNLVKPKVRVGRFLPVGIGLEPKTVAQEVVGSMNPKHVVDMSLEMVDIDALDTGRYQAMVIQDPNDKRNITGYLHFWMPWGLSYHTGHWDWENKVKHGVRRLILKLNQWTDIKADVKGVIGFASEELLDTPWVLLAHWFKMYPTDGELENICRYMNSGGFIFTDGDPVTDLVGIIVAGVRAEGGCSVVRCALEYGGYEESRAWSWQRLPHTHAIFHCYFDFPAGPPLGTWSMCHADWGARAPDTPRTEAIELGGRIVAVTNNAIYNEVWAEWGNDGYNRYYPDWDPTRQLQFGINTIIFALTQEGSITHRLMKSVQ